MVEDKIKARERSKIWYKENREKKKIYNKDNCKEKTEEEKIKIRETARLWYQANREKCLAKAKKRYINSKLN